MRCLRGLGVIDDSTGTRCKSMEFHTQANSDGLHRCDLLYEDLLQEGWEWDSDPDVEHYERLLGAGCWVYTEDCPNMPSHSGLQITGMDSMSNTYETACH